MTDYYVDEDYQGGYGGHPEAYHDDDDPPPRRRLLPARPRSTGRFDELEGRTTWLYLALLGVLFVVLVLFSWACDVDSTTPTDLLPTPGETRTEAGDVAVRLTITVDGDVVRLIGGLPDEAALQQVLDAAGQLYGPENVIDELAVDGATTMDDGVVSITGTVESGDTRPEQLRDALTSGLGLSVGEFVVQEGGVIVEPVALEVELTDGGIRFRGDVPGDGSAVELSAIGESVYGPGSADISAVSVGEVTWTEGRVDVTGTVTPGDERHLSLPDEFRDRFGPLVEVDVSGVGVDTGPEAIAAVDTAITEALAAQSITFGANSAEIEPASDDVLATIAEQLQTIPGVTVEVVGHTDDLGPDDQNLALSQLRAEAVVARLVELGLDEARFTARGEGEASPIADNGTAAGRAENRRIEFILAGSGP